MQYLAFQDLCAVSECNIEPWRRGAFFEESGETYKRIVTACLKPLEDFTSKIAEALEGFSSDKPELLSQQSKLYGAFSDSQVIWQIIFLHFLVVGCSVFFQLSILSFFFRTSKETCLY
jgi:hypothetical protein